MSSARRVATIGAVGAAGYLIVVPMLHIHGPVYPVAPRAGEGIVRAVPSPNPYLPLGPAPTVSQSSPAASSSGGSHHRLIRGYFAYRMLRRMTGYHRWGMRSPIRNPLPWWMR